jgi:hypothetical protein
MLCRADFLWPPGFRAGITLVLQKSE